MQTEKLIENESFLSAVAAEFPWRPFMRVGKHLAALPEYGGHEKPTCRQIAEAIALFCDRHKTTPKATEPHALEATMTEPEIRALEEAAEEIRKGAEEIKRHEKSNRRKFIKNSLLLGVTGVSALAITWPLYEKTQQEAITAKGAVTKKDKVVHTIKRVADGTACSVSLTYGVTASILAIMSGFCYRWSLENDKRADELAATVETPGKTKEYLFDLTDEALLDVMKKLKQVGPTKT